MTEVIANEKQANEKITSLIQDAYASLNEAESIADKWGLSFSFEVTYGMGGYYTGKVEERWWESDFGYDKGTMGWLPSSRSC